VAVMLSLVSLYGYCKVFESKNGAFMLTAVSVLNDEIILSSDGLYRDLSFADGELNELLAEFPQGDTLSMDARYHWLVQLRYSYPMPVHKRFLSEARRQIGARWYAHAAIRFFESMNEKPFLGVDDPFYGYLMDSMFHLRLSVFYLLTAIYALVFLKQVVKRRSANWLSLAVLLVCWGQVGVMFLGTYCDYSRMVMPAVPAACVMVSQLLSCFRVKMSPAVLASFGAPPAPTAREF
jgi:hypothetical protein